MVLRAFWWGSGNGSYEPCKTQFLHYYHYYRPSWGVFDSTGTQKGFEELFNVENNLSMYGMNLAAGIKGECILALKLLMGKGLMKWPPSIKGIFRQLVNYELPDKKLIQDIVSNFQMAAGFAKQFYWLDADAQEEPEAPVEELDRHGRHTTDRSQRSAYR
jgi:hypothetical protein